MCNRRSEERGGSHGDTQGDLAATQDGGQGQAAVAGSCTPQSGSRTITDAHVRCPRRHLATNGIVTRPQHAI